MQEVKRMNLSKHRTLLLRAGLVLALGLGLAILAFNTDPGLEKFEAVYQRGEYEICSAELIKALDRNPDWHEARKLLIQTQLAAEQPTAALKNWLFLVDSQHRTGLDSKIQTALTNCQTDDIGEIRLTLKEYLTANPDSLAIWELLIDWEISRSELRQAMEHLAQVARLGHRLTDSEITIAQALSLDQGLKILTEIESAEPGFWWAKEMKLRLAVEHQAVEKFPVFLEGYHQPADEMIMAKWWEQALDQGLPVALELALETGDQSLVEGVLALAEVTGPDNPELPELLERMPTEPRLLALQAWGEESPRDCLNALLELEAQGYVPENTLAYGRDKFALIQRLSGVEPQWLDFIPPDLVIKQALEWQDSRALVLVDWLEFNGSGDQRIKADVLRQVLTYQGSTPELLWSSSKKTRGNVLSLAPGGKWIIPWSSPALEFVNLDTGQAQAKLGTTHTNVVWSPNGQKLAIVEPGPPYECLRGYTPETNYCQLIPLPYPQMKVLGWRDNTSVFASSHLDDSEEPMVKVLLIDIETEEILWESESKTVDPVLTSTNSLAWLRRDGNKLTVEAQGEDTQITVPSPDFHYMECFPQQDILIFQALDSNEVYTLNLADNELVTLKLPAPYQAGNWIDEKHICALFPLENSNALVKVNMETGTFQYTGLTLPDKDIQYSCQGDLLAIHDGQEVKVYKMP